MRADLVSLNAALSLGLLLACSQNSDGKERLSQSDGAQAAPQSMNAEMSSNVEAWEVAGADNRHQAGSDGEGDYRAPSNYLKYPKELRSLIRKADLENDHCRGGSGDIPETWQACNRRDQIMAQLEKRGWCWGGSHVGYLEHWLPCAEDPDYRPGQDRE